MPYVSESIPRRTHLGSWRCGRYDLAAEVLEGRSPCAYCSSGDSASCRGPRPRTLGRVRLLSNSLGSWFQLDTSRFQYFSGLCAPSETPTGASRYLRLLTIVECCGGPCVSRGIQISCT